MDVECEFQLNWFNTFGVIWKNVFFGVFLQTKSGQIDRPTYKFKKKTLMTPAIGYIYIQEIFFSNTSIRLRAN